MLKIKKLILLIVTFVFCTKIAYADSNLHSRIAQVLKENDSLVRKLNIGIKVDDLQTGKEVYAYNPYHSMAPASVTKSFTAYAALEYLKPDFTYSTQVLFDPNKVNSQNALTEDLYIKFLGDPSLTKDELKQLLNKLKTYNIQKISRNIIIDDFIFDQMYQAPGWVWDDNKFCFAAPTSAIVINKNCFHMKLLPSKSINDLTQLIPVTKVYANVTNETTTQKNNNCAPELTAFFENDYNLSGCLDIQSPEIPLRIAYQNPRLMIEFLIKELLLEQNIQFTGDILFNPTPSSMKVIVEHKSEPLKTLVYNMMKDSDNVSADNFLKTIGAYYYNTQGTFNNGVKALTTILAKTSIDFNQMRLIDGSGGSRYNLISPNQFVQLYKTAYKNINFYNALPIAGIDGSLKELTNPALSGKIYAKTGSMSGVSSLSGYLQKDNQQILVFTIMINGLGTRTELKDLIEQILEEISK